MRYSWRSIQGFTLIETFVAISILAISVAAVLSVASQSMQAALVSGDQATATFLSQDAVEFVHWVRDTNVIKGVGASGSSTSVANWLRNGSGSAQGLDLSPCIGGSGSCAIDTIIPAVVACTIDASCATLYLCTSNVGYQTYQTEAHNTGCSASKFSRTISIKMVNTHEAIVTSVVSWQSHGTKHSVSASETIFAWQ